MIQTKVYPNDKLNCFVVGISDDKTQLSFALFYNKGTESSVTTIKSTEKEVLNYIERVCNKVTV